MSAAENKGIVSLPVLDRLMDQEPKARSEAIPTPAQSLRALKAGLRRDLEWLMNSRRTIQEPPEACAELKRSVYCYGLPDMSSLSTASVADQTLLLKSIESAITVFEPRLTAVRVKLAPTPEAAQRLHFVIEGLLRLDPVPEPIVFDTILELTSGSYQIRGDAGAR